ncbi:hypothetical protein DFP72DRAFT_905128 [Ephemerocybe angulata]|uniref:Uncharacterized protein n=1 Tax=Ephemerocybe angulata TaxID=980116 RepID=A0A8H6HUU3_9AGAR|nr:hypothetical protein DFP72DRAFT_905128 [Tulosesus angulatus]
MSLPAREKYAGETRRLLLAFDIGTTFSGISYSILDPGNVPEIRPVTRYPFQEQAGGNSKIPTVIYYDLNGTVAAIGAETLKDGIEADAEELGWSKACWFKLHLRPKPAVSSRANAQVEVPLPPLPPNKTVVNVFTDYMEYLHSCAKKYISETHGNPFWTSLEDDIMYVLTHPNGWGGPQQAQMREAALRAGFIPNTDEGRSRVTFVTEGEASLHFCLSNGLTIEGAGESSGVLIVDAGGGTIDLTAYSKLPDHSFEEIAIPQCHFQGAAYVTMRAERYFTALLGRSRFAQDIKELTTRFDRTTKHVFQSEDEPLHIQFTSHRERDPALNIRAGRLTLEGRNVATFFEPSVSCIVDAIEEQISSSYKSIKTVFLVGGFSASNWLYEQVRERTARLGVTLSRPDTHVNKAVSNGAVSFYLDSAVTSRVSRLTYGIKTYVRYDPTNVEHRNRSHRTSIHPALGVPILICRFYPILHKNTRVKATSEFRQTFHYEGVTRGKLNKAVESILSYCGPSTNPEWIDEDTDNLYPSVCVVEADTSSVQSTIKTSASGLKYHEINFDVILLFGLTELKAQIAYIQNGVERRGRAQVVYRGSELV